MFGGRSASSGDMGAALERLNALTDKLESVLSRVVGSGGGAGSVAVAAPPASTSSTSSSSSSSSPLDDWHARIPPVLSRLQEASSSSRDPEIDALTQVLAEAFAEEEKVLRRVASLPSRPAGGDADVAAMLSGVSAAAQRAQELASGGGGGGRWGSGGNRKPAPKRTNQAKAVAEFVPALFWVAFSGPSCGMSPPPQHVDEAWQAAEFYANKAAVEVRSESSSSSPSPDAAAAAAAQGAWLRELRTLATALREHVAATAPQGPAWGVGGGGGGSAVAAPAAAPAPPPPPQRKAAAPPPPPPPPPPGGPGSLLKKEPTAAAAAAAAPAPSASSGGGGGMAAVLAAIAAKGDAATRGLRKVTDDMKTKNRSKGDNDESVVPASLLAGSSASPAATRTTTTTNSTSSSRPPPPARLACEQGRKWVVEHYRGGGGGGNQNCNHDSSVPILVDGATAKQSVYVYGCHDVVVHIKGKVNAVSVDNCRRVAVDVDGGVVASVEAVNSSSLVLRNSSGVVATWALDKCNGLSLCPSKESLKEEGSFQVTTAQCSEVNIVLPEEEGEGGNEEEGQGPTELPVPEQFVTRVVEGKRLVTEPVAHSGA